MIKLLFVTTILLLSCKSNTDGVIKSKKPLIGNVYYCHYVICDGDFGGIYFDDSCNKYNTGDTFGKDNRSRVVHDTIYLEVNENHSQIK